MMNTISPYVNKLIDGKVLSLTLFRTKAHYWFGQVFGYYLEGSLSVFTIFKLTTNIIGSGIYYRINPPKKFDHLIHFRKVFVIYNSVFIYLSLNQESKGIRVTMADTLM